ncbi:hypothetical protein ALC60_07874 [Trachymyrmex zeteki]|uniref:Uncharacterized protein n=1 Tax=Mycetomoellerius zeteki TaxID=64791 RepID=A0A151WZ30_9HYME|nr:hypothetical protein ALC60_07874 [Trachymyrmex zeteki]
MYSTTNSTIVQCPVIFEVSVISTQVPSEREQLLGERRILEANDKNFPFHDL